MTTTTNTISRTAIHEGDRQLRRTCVRFGEEFREIRLRAGVAQATVARAIGVARSVICRIEQGNPDVSPRIRARAAAVLGADLRLAIYPEAAPLIHDAAHAKIVEAVLALGHPRWRATIESPVPGPGRRSSDIRLDHGLDTVLIEVESRVRALEAIIREGAEKRAAVAATIGPGPPHPRGAGPATDPSPQGSGGDPPANRRDGLPSGIRCTRARPDGSSRSVARGWDSLAGTETRLSRPPRQCVWALRTAAGVWGASP
jgi:transcriptional regulator with XRE-family HTH domain